jgi:hypothetical protein
VFELQQSDMAHRAPPTGVTPLDRNVIARDISATIFLQPNLVDVSDGVHVLWKALVLPTARTI